MSNDIPTIDSNDPEQLRRDIEQTRVNLSQNVNALGEAVEPGAVAKRQVEKVQDKVVGAGRGLKEKVMGSDDDYGDSSGLTGKLSDAGDTVGDMAASARAQVENAPSAARRRTRGNPLAAGLVALGAGWLLGSLLPASEKERQLAATAKDAVEEKGQPLLEEAKSVVQEAAENLKEPAQDAANALKESAQESVEKVKAEGQGAAQTVKESAQESKDAVQRNS
ncbi:conserved hypothetical protein [Nostocoides australiense Ben110]|uniref:DUF3618 domain-containing protein n=1 Tax=Nostocoides australiense Ben110 TaxID=1193182 RepID=W6JYQ2_9MICO|nr:DUF3618 domain-containing protein [Tetrasphaera australiensis]CCH74262.1 conserved hypothetical protein [Tetrasphaera australiensis Ben110]